MHKSCRVVVVLGVSGAGKTTVGRELARLWNCEFIEGDDFHPDANKKKMHDGIPLTDEDRQPWLDALAGVISAVIARNGRAVLSCSALKRAYRDELRRDEVQFVYLRVPRDTVRARLAKRGGHFFNPALLDSQFAALEEPRRALTVDASQDVRAIVREIARQLPECAPGPATEP